MLSNAYFLAKIGADTAENEPAKNLLNFLKIHFSKMHFRKMHFRKMHFRKMHFRKILHVDLAEEHAPGRVDAEEQALGRAVRRHGPEVVEAHRHEDHAKVRQQSDRRVHRRLRAAPQRRRAREERRRLADERLGAPDSLDSLKEAAHLRGHKPVPLYFF